MYKCTSYSLSLERNYVQFDLDRANYMIHEFALSRHVAGMAIASLKNTTYIEQVVTCCIAFPPG